LILMVCAIGLFLIGYQWGNQRHFGQPPAIDGVLIAPPMALPAFALVDSAGRPFGREQLLDHWTLLAFGDPAQARGQLAIQRLLDVYHRLPADAEPRQRLHLVLAAPVPREDLARDFSRLSPALRLVAGEAGDLGQLTSLLGEPVNPGPQDRSTLYLITPDARLLALFPASQPAEALATDLTLLADWPLEALENLNRD
jgi:hypothetical protein